MNRSVITLTLFLLVSFLLGQTTFTEHAISTSFTVFAVSSHVENHASPASSHALRVISVAFVASSFSSLVMPA